MDKSKVKDAAEATEIVKAFVAEIRPGVAFQPLSARLCWMVEVQVGWDRIRFEVDRQSGKIMRFGSEAMTR